MFFDLFAFHWLVSLGFLIFFTTVFLASEASEKYGFSFFSFIMFVGLVAKPTIATLVTNFHMSLSYVLLSYLVLGFLWSLTCWKFFVAKRVEEELETLKARGLIYFGASEALKARNSIDRLIFWVLFWPWSLLWSVANRGIRRAWKSITGVYDIITVGDVRRLQTAINNARLAQDQQNLLRRHE